MQNTIRRKNMRLKINNDPPYHGKLIKLNHFYEIKDNRVVTVQIIEKPEDISELLEWLSYRNEKRYYSRIARVYSTKLKTWFYKVKIHKDSESIFIRADNMDIYVKKGGLTNLLRLSADLRYLTYYSGYKTCRRITATRLIFSKRKTKEKRTNYRNADLSRLCNYT